VPSLKAYLQTCVEEPRDKPSPGRERSDNRASENKRSPFPRLEVATSTRAK
jgi:hypothetical protein